ncbi:LacI family DNA-binding transcriptional regulator, partial [Chryseosolibacter indicus]
MLQMNTKNIRIKDIAQLAGVSVGTVDRVLHNRGRVSEEALKKVLSVLEQIDYKPNLIARTLGSNKTYKIAALIPNPDQDPYWASSKSGISLAEAEWLRYGVKVEPYFFNLYDKSSFKQIAESVSEAQPDGILIAPIFYHEALPFFEVYKTNEIPYVLFNTNIPEAEAISFIGQNLYQSGRVGAELMYFAQENKSGVLTVLHINEDLGNSVHLAEKERGFREYFDKRTDHQFEINTLNLNDASNLERQLEEYLSQKEIKGIFVTTSKGTYVIASILEKLNQTNVKLVGYDMLQENIRFMKKGVVDFLINQNPKRQAFLGISHLVGHLILKKDAPQQELLPLEIISKENLDSYLNS